MCEAGDNNITVTADSSHAIVDREYSERPATVTGTVYCSIWPLPMAEADAVDRKADTEEVVQEVLSEIDEDGGGRNRCPWCT